jgi:hypothetical protein
MTCESLNWDLLVRAMDKELSAAEERLVERHLDECECCRREYAEVEHFSREIAAAVGGAAVAEDGGVRERLAEQISERELLKTGRPIAPDRVMRRFGWGMAIAATLALGIIFAPKQKNPVNESAPTHEQAAGAIEVDGETFIALPYSNPDMPASAPRIVQMQVPVSSLADIGIAMEPVSNVVLNQDRSVLADVLLGADGQPLGVHVVSWE